MLPAIAGIRIFRVRQDRDRGVGSSVPQQRAGTTCRVVLLDLNYLYVLRAFQRASGSEIRAFQRKIWIGNPGVSAWKTPSINPDLWMSPTGSGVGLDAARGSRAACGSRGLPTQS